MSVAPAAVRNPALLSFGGWEHYSFDLMMSTELAKSRVNKARRGDLVRTTGMVLYLKRRAVQPAMTAHNMNRIKRVDLAGILQFMRTA
jgi:hypothetical protein